MKQKILVAEDYEDARIMLKFMLEELGYEVAEAADGIETLEIVERDVPDLILMDIAMPGMNGIDATKAIRKLRGREIPIICVTAHGSQYHEIAIAAGCNDLITKPFDFDHFESVIRHYLSKNGKSW